MTLRQFILVLSSVELTSIQLQYLYFDIGQGSWRSLVLAAGQLLRVIVPLQHVTVAELPCYAHETRIVLLANRKCIKYLSTHLGFWWPIVASSTLAFIHREWCYCDIQLAILHTAVDSAPSRLSNIRLDWHGLTCEAINPSNEPWFVYSLHTRWTWSHKNTEMKTFAWKFLTCTVCHYRYQHTYLIHYDCKADLLPWHSPHSLNALSITMVVKEHFAFAVRMWKSMKIKVIWLNTPCMAFFCWELRSIQNV